MDSTFDREDQGFLRILSGDGRPLLALFAVGLGLAGAFAWFVSAAGETLPHELRFLGMTADELRRLAGGRVADFMTHDRVAFGGTLIAMAILDIWLVEVPLAAGERWAWWLLLVSGSLGFASFLAYLGYGYLDLWHAVATAALLPLFVGGLWMTKRSALDPGPRSALPNRWPAWSSVGGAGRGLLGLTGIGMIVAGTTIVTLGTFVVFVPQDLVYIGLDRQALEALNPHLVPLIAHDRVGFGAGLLTIGTLVIGCIAAGRLSRSLWQALLAAGSIGFGAAIGIHGLVGYLDASHVGPAVAGAAVFGLGMILSRPGSAPGVDRSAEHLSLAGESAADGMLGPASSHPAGEGRTA
jgi:hypothetical protein